MSYDFIKYKYIVDKCRAIFLFISINFLYDKDGDKIHKIKIKERDFFLISAYHHKRRYSSFFVLV